MTRTIKLCTAIYGALISAFCLVLFACVFETNRGVLYVYALDIGQGDALYIRTPQGRDMLIDTGPDKRVLEKVSQVMPWYDRSLDVVVITHPDLDHIGGLPHVLDRYTVDQFIDSGKESDNYVYKEVERILLEKDITRRRARAGTRIDFGDGAYFDVLYPDINVTKVSTNDASLVGKLSFGSSSIMFMGDASISVENHLVDVYSISLESTLLKAGHHGSKTSTGDLFLDTVMPERIVLSLGKNNRYGHPHKDVISRIESRSIPYDRTDTDGTIKYIFSRQGLLEP